MNQYRSTFWIYLIIWLVLVLAPAAYVMVGRAGQEELKQLYTDTKDNVALPLLEKYGFNQALSE